MSNELTSVKNEKPTFLQNIEDETGTEGLKRFIRPKFLKVIQSSGSLRKELGRQEGDVVKMPSQELFMEYGEKRLVTPVFHWFQWELWYDYNAGVNNPVKDRSLDPDSEIAQICKGDPENWQVPDPEHEGLPLSYKEDICFVFYVHETQELVAVNFVGGEHKTGRNFGELVATRNAPIYAGVYEMSVGTHKNPKNASQQWEGFNFDNAGWVNEETFTYLKDQYEKQEAAHKKNLLFVDQNEAPSEGEAVDASQF